MSDTRNHTTRDQLAEHFRRRSNGIWADEIEEQHRHKGIDPAHCNDSVCRRAVEDADALLASDAIAAVRAAAVAETTAAIEAVAQTIANAAAEPVENFTPNAWRQLLYMAAHDLRAALSGGRTALDTTLAQAWDDGRHARPQYLGPTNGHYEDCMGWNDCHCGTYTNPYRTGADQ